MSEKAGILRNLSWHCALVRSSHENFSCLALLFMCRHQNLMSESSSLSIAAGFAIVERVLSAGFSANRDVNDMESTKTGVFSSCGSTLLLPYEENTPGFRVSDIPPVLNLAPVLHAIEITTPERRSLPFPELV